MFEVSSSGTAVKTSWCDFSCSYIDIQSPSFYKFPLSPAGAIAPMIISDDLLVEATLELCLISLLLPPYVIIARVSIYIKMICLSQKSTSEVLVGAQIEPCNFLRVSPCGVGP